MNTPIVDFVNNYIDSNTTRMHMPGHKGAAFLGFEDRDITEINGADSLYHAEGIIAESEANASQLFGTARTLYSTEGSSQCIKTMLDLAILYWKKKNIEGRPVIIAGRNAHLSFIHSAMLLDFDIEWLWPEGDDILSCNIDESLLNDMIKKADEKLAGVYITSPDYLGNVAGIDKLAEICHKNETLLLVDNAHGAYLKFIESSTKYSHPITLGADMCCDSAHKTLPVLTGGAYLHIGKNADSFLSDKAKMRMNIYGSTSPSYLTLQSLDYCNNYLENNTAIPEYCKIVDEIKNRIRSLGYNVLENEPLKITIKSKNGIEFSENLRTEEIECEYADNDYVVLMLTPQNSIETLENLIEKLGKIAYSDSTDQSTVVATRTIPQRSMSIREAMMASSEKVNVENSEGRICASPIVSCPPAIPVVVAGEVIDRFAIETLIRYNIKVVECVNE